MYQEGDRVWVDLGGPFIERELATVERVVRGIMNEWPEPMYEVFLDSDERLICHGRTRRFNRHSLRPLSLLEQVAEAAQ